MRPRVEALSALLLASSLLLPGCLVSSSSYEAEIARARALDLDLEEQRTRLAEVQERVRELERQEATSNLASEALTLGRIASPQRIASQSASTRRSRMTIQLTSARVKCEPVIHGPACLSSCSPSESRCRPMFRRFCRSSRMAGASFGSS